MHPYIARPSDSCLEEGMAVDVAATFASANHIVVGDLMVDEYAWGAVSRVSPEAPIPVLDYEAMERAAGGAANVAHNLVALGQSVSLAGVVGPDDAGIWLLNEMERLGVSTSGIVVDPTRVTTRKLRYGTRHHSILRVDFESRGQLSDLYATSIASYINEALKSGCSSLLVSDYGKGCLTGSSEDNPVLRCLADIPKSRGVHTGVDTKRAGAALRVYEGITFAKPNLTELENAVQMHVHDEATLSEACYRYLELSQADSVVVTLGPQGMAYLSQRDRDSFRIVPTIECDVYDVTGAGDTVFATLATALANDYPWPDAMLMANIAASIVIEHRGTAVVTEQELSLRLARAQAEPTGQRAVLERSNPHR